MKEVEENRPLTFNVTRQKLANAFDCHPKDVSMEDILADLNPKREVKPGESNSCYGVTQAKREIAGSRKPGSDGWGPNPAIEGAWSLEED